MKSNYLVNAGSGQVWDSYTTIPAPPGTSLGQMTAQGMLAEVATTLQLNPLGVYTPWASRTGDMSWEEIVRPDTNVVLWSLTDEQVNAVPAITFGTPLPFVVIVTRGPLTQSQINAMWQDTAYKPYETQAVYRQDDAKPTPTIFFMHWGERIDIADNLGKKLVPLTQVAAEFGGTLVFAAQVAAQGTTTRDPVAVPFGEALQLQMAMNALPPPVPAYEPPLVGPVTPPVTAQVNLGVPIAAGIGAAVLGYMLWSKRGRT
jgi:hypothetical protein